MNPEVLEQAAAIVEQIYEMTHDLLLTGEKEHEEAEAEAYTNLMEDRAALVDDMNALRVLLDDEVRALPAFKALMERIAAVDALDKKHRVLMEKIRDGMRDSIRDMKNARQSSYAYSTSGMDGFAHYVDTKK